MSRTTNDIDNVVTTLNSSGADTIYSIFQLVGMIVMMTAINWRLALITVIIIPVSGWIVTLISRFVRKEYQKQWYYTGMINSNVEESVNGHNIVKLYGQEEKSWKLSGSRIVCCMNLPSKLWPYEPIHPCPGSLRI